MATIHMKTMTACLVDVGSSMLEPIIQPNKMHDNYPSKLSVATSFIGSHLIQRVMATKTGN